MRKILTLTASILFAGFALAQAPDSVLLRFKPEIGKPYKILLVSGSLTGSQPEVSLGMTMTFTRGS